MKVLGISCRALGVRIMKKFTAMESQRRLRMLVTLASTISPEMSKRSVSPRPMPSVWPMPCSTETSGSAGSKGRPDTMRLYSGSVVAYERLSSRSSSRRARSSSACSGPMGLPLIPMSRPRTMGESSTGDFNRPLRRAATASSSPGMMLSRKRLGASTGMLRPQACTRSVLTKESMKRAERARPSPSTCATMLAVRRRQARRRLIHSQPDQLRGSNSPRPRKPDQSSRPISRPKTPKSTTTSAAMRRSPLPSQSRPASPSAATASHRREALPTPAPCSRSASTGEASVAITRAGQAKTRVIRKDMPAACSKTHVAAMLNAGSGTVSSEASMAARPI